MKIRENRGSIKKGGEVRKNLRKKGKSRGLSSKK